IVGPNGSGKSNISEAIMWALGERSSRNLRVQSLEELIFSGSSARPAVSVAEVDLVLDNSDNTLPIEFDQVVISRRMYRSGESEYFINASPCRRMDIIDILYDSGIGQAVHSIISQGNLTAVLESHPEERRELIEDAAGVLKHKKRKERAARKIDAMDLSLARVNDIVRIIDSQLRPLERQAQRAQEHDVLIKELKELDLSLVVDDLRQLQSEWNQLSKRGNEIEAEAELAHFRLNERETELARRQIALEEKGLFVGDINEQRIRCLSIIQRLDAGMLLLEEKGKNMVARLSELRATIYNSKTRLTTAEGEYENLARESHEARARLEALYARFNELTRESEVATRTRKEVEERYSELTAQVRSRETALDSSRALSNKANDSIASIDLEDSLLRERFEQVDSEFSSTQGILAARRAKLDDIENGLSKARRESEITKNEIDKFVRILDERKRRLDARRAELADLQAQLRGLEEIDRAFEAASPALSWIMERKSELAGVIGPLSQSFKIKKGVKLPFDMSTTTLEHLVERLLGADFFGLLVNNNDSARIIAERLLANGDKQGVISLLPVENMRAIADQSIRGERLVDYLDYPIAQHPAYLAMLGDIYFAPSIAEAQRYHFRDRLGVRFVTVDGAILWPNGKLTLGVQVNDVDGVLERRRKMEALTEEIDGLVNQVSDVELEVSSAELNLSNAQQDDFDITQNLAKLQGDADSVREDVARLEESMTLMLVRREENERKLADVRRRRESAMPLRAEYEQRIETLSAELADINELVDTTSQKLLSATEEKHRITESLSDCKINLETSKGALNYNSSRLDTIQKEIKQLRTTFEVTTQTERSLNLIRLRIDPLYKLYGELHAGATRWAEKLQNQALLEQTDSTNLRKVINEATKAVEDARGAINEINERRTFVLVEQGKLESSVQHAMQRIVDEYKTSLEAALEVPSPDNRNQSEERANRLRKKIVTLGAVNHVAASEYEALKARRDYMLEQTNDLSEARKALARISAALDKKMRNQFLETFDAVNRNFQEIFAILFPGGTGQLILTEGDTPESIGIEVSAQPRGKKILKLSMMSGGEKSLVALALLFAIYRIREVPFYVLDEVDAALDDTNLNRLLDYLDHMRATTQLILVSHQRRTMERADVLYGVTMQAAGVSKLVSQRLEQALGYATSSDKTVTEAGT
ncbi:MAG: chromosome segregation protein SMC, partial [Coriobacteriia bacterium]|nr:chromosome segregation protein SMC [Coriobacteriia bacterium]